MSSGLQRAQSGREATASDAGVEHITGALKHSKPLIESRVQLTRQLAAVGCFRGFARRDFGHRYGDLIARKAETRKQDDKAKGTPNRRTVLIADPFTIVRDVRANSACLIALFVDEQAAYNPIATTTWMEEIQMLFMFPPESYGRVREDYERPYENPIAASAGSFVQPVLDGSMTTDFMGWTWCIGEDGRAGWVPDSWCEQESDKWRLSRDFNALELTVQQSERLKLIYSESGFVMTETASGERGWVPDAILALESGTSQQDEGTKAAQPTFSEAK